MGSELERHSHIENIQILRGVAACMVLLYHATLNIGGKLFFDLLVIGNYAVDFFFVLSGFIICYVNFHHFGEKQRLSYYLSRRLIRIYPIHIIVVLLTLLVYWASRSAGLDLLVWLKRVDADLILRSVFLMPGRMPELNPPAWTLSFELLFYLIFALCFFVRKQVFAAIMGLWLLGILFHKFFPFSKDIYLNFIFNGVNIQFFYGCAVAWVVRSGYLSNLDRSTAKKLAISGIVLLICFSALRKLDPSATWRHLFIGCPISCILIGAIILDTRSNGRLRKFALLLGNASYSIYLVHSVIEVMLVSALKMYVHKYILFFVISSAAVSAGCLLYICIERPFLNWAYARSPWSRKPSGAMLSGELAVR